MPSGDFKVGNQKQAGRDHRGRPWVVDLEWWVVGGELKPKAVTVTSAGGVDASMLRSVPLAAIADDGRPEMAELYRRHDERPELSAADRQRVRKVLAAARPPADDPELLELVATTYRRAALETRAPTKAVHEELVRRGRPLSRQQAGKLVMRCREVGLLGPAERGRPGEQPRRRKGAGK